MKMIMSNLTPHTLTHTGVVCCLKSCKRNHVMPHIYLHKNEDYTQFSPESLSYEFSVSVCAEAIAHLSSQPTTEHIASRIRCTYQQPAPGSVPPTNSSHS